AFPSDGWRQLVEECTAWVPARRPADFGAVLERLAGLAGNADTVARLDRDMHAITVAEHTAALEADPEDVAALVARGNAYARRGAYDEALADYTEAIRLSPRDPALYYNRGNAHFGKGALAQAVADYTEALRRDPSHAWAFGNRGKAYARLGQHARAAADFG